MKSFKIVFLTGMVLASALTACNVTSTQLGSNFYPTVEISYLNSVVTVSAASVLSGSSETITLSLEDTNFNPFVTTLDQITFQASGGTSTGTFGAVTNNGNGTYSASFFGVTAGTAITIHAFVNGNEIQSAAPTVTVLTGNETAASISVSSGNPQSTTAGNAVGSNLVAIVKDSNANALSGVAVTWAISSGTGTLTACSSTTDNSGFVYCGFTASNLAGTSTVTASVAGVVTPATFTIAVTYASPSAPTGLTVGSLGDASVSLSWTAPMGSNGPLTYSIFRGTSASGESSTAVATGISGTSFIDNASSVNPPVADTTYFYVVKAVGAGGSSGLSNEVSATPFGSATQLTFTTQPSSASSGASLGSNIQVKVEDAGGIVVTNSSLSITLALTAANGATLSGSLTQSPASGVATFSGLNVNLVGNYTLTASGVGVTSAVSTGFTISAGVATQFAFTAAPNTTRAVTCTGPFTLKATDSNGNLASLSLINVLLSEASGSGTQTYYTDSSCSTPITCSGGTIQNCVPFSGSASFWFEDDAAESTRITADAGGSSGFNPQTVTTASIAVAQSISQISGLKLWLKADAITGVSNGSPISAWNDSSGNSINLLQSTPASQPIYVTNAQNGLPVVRMAQSGAGYLEEDSAIPLSSGSAFTLFFVSTNTDPTGGAAGPTLWIGGTSIAAGQGFLIYSYPGYANLIYNPLGYSSYADGRAVVPGMTVATYQYNGAGAVSTWTNGSVVDSNAACGGWWQAGSSSVILEAPPGLVPNGWSPVSTDFAEVIIYNRVLTPNEIATVHSYLNLKWNLY